MSGSAVDVTTFIFAIGATPLLVWLVGRWITSRIDSSIRHEYDKRRAEFDGELRRRERAQLVAELLAEWMSSPMDGGMSTEQRRRLNRLSFEATLWLPEEIAEAISRILQYDPKAPNMFDVLLSVRTHLSGKHRLTAENITQWSREVELINYGLPPGSKRGYINIYNVNEEVAGQFRRVSESELKNGYSAPVAAKMHFLIQRDSSSVPVTYQGSVSLQLVHSGLCADNQTTIYAISTMPSKVADDINRHIAEITKQENNLKDMDKKI